jgi:hypothetical protein
MAFNLVQRPGFSQVNDGPPSQVGSEPAIRRRVLGFFHNMSENQVVHANSCTLQSCLQPTREVPNRDINKDLGGTVQ